MAALKHAAVTAALALMGCGEGLVERGYRGEVLFDYEGQVTTAGRTVDFEHPLRASLFWSTETDEAGLDDDLVEQPAISVAVRFPGIFQINVFQRPPDHAWEDPEAGFRVGFVLLYEDINRNGRMDEGELRGGSADQVLLYAERALEPLQSPTGRALAVGFHTARLPMACPWLELNEPPEVEPTLPAGCTDPVGQACATDAECGAGTCRLQVGGTLWPNGYCTVPADSPTCGGPTTPVLDGQVLLPCEDDDECRLNDGYVCVEGDNPVLGCQPGAPSALVVDPMLQLQRVCADGEAEDD